ncbi:putative pla2g4b [Schizothecium vesticola]|uniref:Pla2g4b n=1 Tax=Schizothecium vesticola TaxID=314040 RepID=A0AA40F7P3_9PEZI|nr:putative pla2g4b [Schizothecium vesticola]
MDDAITELITSYNELNSSSIIELDQEPSPLEFMRFVAKNTPFVVRGGAAGWKAIRDWSVAYLKETLANEQVNVAVTPFGNADAPTPHPDGSGSLVFAKPHEELQPFPKFLDYLIQQEHHPDTSPSEVRYAQTQNNNLPLEYPLLAPCVPASIPFAHIALSPTPSSSSTTSPTHALPDATNLWIGNSRSTTALHRDAYENIYVQIRGRKSFVLLPPACQPCVNEIGLWGATYRRSGSGGLELVLDGDEGDGDGEVPFAPVWDPDRPAERGTKWSGLGRAVRVMLGEGDMLYLPCLWYHKVSQACGEEGVCVAVNYWYDMDFGGPLYPFSNFVRAVGKANSKGG